MSGRENETDGAPPPSVRCGWGRRVVRPLRCAAAPVHHFLHPAGFHPPRGRCLGGYEPPPFRLGRPSPCHRRRRCICGGVDLTGRRRLEQRFDGGGLQSLQGQKKGLVAIRWCGRGRGRGLCRRSVCSGRPPRRVRARPGAAVGRAVAPRPSFPSWSFGPLDHDFICSSFVSFEPPTIVVIRLRLLAGFLESGSRSQLKRRMGKASGFSTPTASPRRGPYTTSPWAPFGPHPRAPATTPIGI